jgi:hypothetical protein
MVPNLVETGAVAGLDWTGLDWTVGRRSSEKQKKERKKERKCIMDSLIPPAHFVC